MLIVATNGLFADYLPKFQAGSYSNRTTLNNNIPTAIQAELKSQQITANSSINYKIDNIGDFGALNFYFPWQSTGNITTANVAWYLSDRTTLLSNDTLTSGTDLINFKSNNCVITFYNYSATANITGNILATKY
jgi:hypothetical protein